MSLTKVSYSMILGAPINVLDFGAVGDGVTNDTAAFQAALDYIGSAGGGELYIPSNTYMIAADTFPGGGDDYGLIVSNNTTINMTDGTILKVITTANDNYRIFSVVNKSNITINGGVLYGDLETHTTSTEHGYGIAILGSSDVYINSVITKQFKGDGIYVGYSTSIPFSQRIHIRNCIIHTNYRNGIAFTGCADSSISGCSVYNHLTYSGVGIDLEPDATRIVQNINVTNCNLSDNIVGIGIQRTAGNGATLEKLNITSNTIREVTSGVTIVNANSVNVVGNQITNSTVFGVYVLHSSYINIASNFSKSNTTNGFVYLANTSGVTEFISVTGNILRSDYSIVNLVGSSGFTVNNVLIADNNANGCVDAILIAYSKNVSVVSNLIEGSSNRGIFFSSNNTFGAIKSNFINLCAGIGIQVATNDTSIETNTVNNCGKEGISVTGTGCILNGNRTSSNGTLTNATYSNILINADRNHIVANQIRRGSNANLPQYGIYIQTGTSNNVASNDMFQGGTTGAFLDSGTSTTTSNNIIV